jgi:hypothetical protein
MYKKIKKSHINLDSRIMKKYLKVDAAATTTKVMNTKTQKESANRDWRDYEWRIVVRFDWTCEDGTEDVDIMGYAYDTKQDAIMDIRRALDVYIDYFRDEEGCQVSDVYFDGDNGHGEIVITEGCVVSMWVESNKLPW